MENLPIFLKNLLEKEYDEKKVDEIIKGYNLKRKTTFRLNTLKFSEDEILKRLDSLNIKYTKYPYLDNAYITDIEAKDYLNTDIVKDGIIYFQSISSMLPAYFLNAKENETILDMCAAPGGKTIVLAQLLNNKVEITSNEVNKIRFERLKHNLETLGVRSYLLNMDGLRLDDYFRFDKILLDAPCSGSGTLDLSNQKQMKSFSFELVKNSSLLQEKLLNKALTILKPNSDMIYSTCSILEDENEKVLNKVLKKHNAKIVPIEMKNVPTLDTKIAGTLKVMPNELFEGFFIAKIHKN